MIKAGSQASMDTVKYYSNAPITEAIIDIRVDLPSSVTVEDLKKIEEILQEDYPNAENHYEFSAFLNFNEAEPIEATGQRFHSGFKYKSKDGKRILQARLDGFTLSQLPPYQTWEPFKVEAYKLWALYRAVVTPKKVHRLALRYINRIDIKPGVEFNTYLKTYPEISPLISQELSNFVMHLELPQRDIESTLLINQAIVPSSDPNFISVLLDLDLFREGSFIPDDDEIWTIFNLLRLRKDEVFEACITDLVREEIK